MSRVSSQRRIERAGVNALRALLEDHDHLVHEIDGGADHGEDLFVGVVEGGRRTGHLMAVQVKSGRKYRRVNGYAIPVGDHREDWEQSKIPVIGVVYDMDQRQLFWTNLTKELRDGNTASWIHISAGSELCHRTIGSFIASVKAFAAPLGTWPAVAPAGVPTAAAQLPLESIVQPGSHGLPDGVGIGHPALSGGHPAPPVSSKSHGLTAVKGILGSINFDGQTVSIRKDGYGPAMKGVQTIHVSEIEHIILRPATAMIYGYIQFVVRHHPPASDRRLSTAFGRPHREDPDSMSFPRRANSDIENLKSAIETAMALHRSTA